MVVRACQAQAKPVSERGVRRVQSSGFSPNAFRIRPEDVHGPGAIEVGGLTDEYVIPHHRRRTAEVGLSPDGPCEKQRCRYGEDRDQHETGTPVE